MANANFDSVYPRNVRPPMTSYLPSMWGDIFTSFTLDDQVQETYAKAIETLKGEARNMLSMVEGDEKLILIDSLERLGVGYHFHQEIKQQLLKIFESQPEHSDLFTTALQFRLLRQHGHPVSSSVFDKFKDINNKFNETLCDDAKGLLSLYEAAHLRTHEDRILDDAVGFTTHHLNRMLQNLESPLKDQVKQALWMSLHRDVPRIVARNFISSYEKDRSKNEIILKLAKLDYNYLQNLYKKELSELSKWWNKFDLKTKLPYARDRLVECYFWGLASTDEPQNSCIRIALTKQIQMLSILNDTFDNYSTFEEADRFMEALERWNLDEIDQLPDYMKIVYKFVLSTYADYELEAAKLGKSFVIPYAIESLKQIGRAYINTKKWFMGRKLPTFDEFIDNSLFTSGIYMIYIPGFLWIESVTKETMDSFTNNPQFVDAGAKICRNLQDACSYKREEKGGEILTVVDCYVNQYGGSKEEAVMMFFELTENAWKVMNRALITKTKMPNDIIEQVLNYARVAEVTYRYGDEYTDYQKIMGPDLFALFMNPFVMI